jgi:serine/threonine protein kinase/type II secretory pathway pseudopilin PulG
MSISTNTKLGRYEIRSKIGEGGMGQVYLAQDIQLDRMVALKVLSSEIARDQQRLYRFLQEARAASKLKSANVAHIYEIGEVEGHHFIAMEYVEGQPLNRKIAAQPMEPAEIVKLGIQIARALDEAHSKGITHRDIKPQNIIVTPDAEVKMLDFGLAKLSSGEPSLAELAADSQLATKVKTSPGIVMGTVNYMSPEQAMGRDVDHRTDIFSLGVVLYEMATGRVPFNGASLTETIDRIAHAQPEAIARFNYKVPAELEVIIKKALRKNRDERYQAARDLLVDLRDLERELEFATRMEHSVAPSTSVSTPPANSEPVTEIVTSGQPSLITSETVATLTNVSSAEYLTREIKRHRKGVAIVLAVLLISGIGLTFGLSKFLSSKRTQNPKSMKMTRLTNNGRVGSASISPDGKYVAYSVRDEAGVSSLWVRHVATTSNVQVVPPDGPGVTFGQSTFSPDGNYIYYLRTDSGLGVLYQVPLFGGTSKKLLEDVSRISFSPDGKRFGFSRRYASEGHDALIVANADGTAEQKLATRTHPDFFLPGTAWSPDGQTIACPAGGFTGGYYRSVAVVNVSDGSQKILTSRKWYGVERLAWLPDGSGIITTAQERAGDQYQLWQISYPEGEARTLTNDLSDYRLVSLTADASALVTVVSDITSNIWLVPNGEWSNGRQLTSTKSNGIGATALLNDGRIIYESRAGGNSDLWIMNADGRNQKQLTDDAYNERFAVATPDGHRIVFLSARPSSASQLWRMDIDGSNAKRLTDSPALNATISPDGKWVVYMTFGPGGFSIWKVSIDGGEPVQIISQYSLSPAISPDGKLIACYYLDKRTGGPKIALIPFEGGEPVKIFEYQAVDAGTYPVRWTHEGHALTYIVNRGGVSNIWIQSLDGSAARQLTDFKSDRIFSFDWSRDGKWLALARGPEQRDVVLMSDFK